MISFSKLFRGHLELSPGEQQRRVEEEFPALVAQGPLHGWHPADPIADGDQRLLLGVATYSEMDMRLLDLVAKAVAGMNGRKLFAGSKMTRPAPAGVMGYIESPPEPLRVDVFSVAACRSQEDFQKYIPGIDKVYQTPVVGLWEAGMLTESEAGARGRALVFRVCGIDPELYTVQA